MTTFRPAKERKRRYHISAVRMYSLTMKMWSLLHKWLCKIATPSLTWLYYCLQPVQERPGGVFSKLMEVTQLALPYQYDWQHHRSHKLVIETLIVCIQAAITKLFFTLAKDSYMMLFQVLADIVTLCHGWCQLPLVMPLSNACNFHALQPMQPCI